MFILGCKVHVTATVSLVEMATTEEKLDAVLKSLESLKEEHKGGQLDLRRRIEQLEKDVMSGQEEATQRVVKRLKEDRTLVFRKKGNLSLMIM